MRSSIGCRLVLSVFLVYAVSTHAVLITFSDQDSDQDVPMQRGGVDGSIYGVAQGLPDGVTATFSGFYLNPSFAFSDHTPDSSDDKMVAGSESPAFITFNTPVEIPSFWVDNSFGSLPQFVGSLGGASQFIFDLEDNVFDFVEITAGVGFQIDLLTFNDFQDSVLDDLQLVAEPVSVIPEAALGIWGVALGVLLTRRTRPLMGRGVASPP